MGVEKLVEIVHMRDEASHSEPAHTKGGAKSTFFAPLKAVVETDEAHGLVWVSAEVND